MSKRKSFRAEMTSVDAIRKGKTADGRPVSQVYKTIDNDLARDNLENDIPAADLQDL